MAKVTAFNEKQFTSTEHTPAKQKAEFANRLATFVLNGFPAGEFTNLLYTKLSNCFGHIAHYNREGFYGVWFATPEKQAAFIKHTLDRKPVGDPKFTFVDVEAAFQEWLKAQNIQIAVETNAASERVYVALIDIADHALTILPGEKTPATVADALSQSVAFVGKFAGAVNADRVAAILADLTRKHATAGVEFRLADLSTTTNSFGHTGHIFLTKAGEVWSVTAYRGGGVGSKNLKVGDSLTVPVKDGKLQWMSLGYEVPEKLGPARPDQIKRVWGET